MITIAADGKQIVLYSSIKELPVIRYKRMHHYLLQEGGIGSTVEDFDLRMGKTISLLQAKNTDDAITELTNMRYSFFSTISELSFGSMAFACLVKSIDGKPFEDISPEGLSAIVELLDQMQMGELQEHWDSVKKKLMPSLKPTSMDGSEVTYSTLTT